MMIRTLGQRSSPVVLRVYSRSLSSDAALVTPLCRGRAHSSAITTARALSSAITSSLSGSKGVSQPWRQQRRSLSTYRFMSGGRSGGLGQLDLWPVTQVNTFINVCHQGERMVVERLGRLHTIESPGWFIAIPVIDRIAYRIDMRERNITIPPQAAITKDNVSVEVSGNLYVQFIDPDKAAYGSADPLYAVRQHAQSSMRASIGELELDEILHARVRLNAMIKETLQTAADAWGMAVKRYEITEITPDKQISEAMDKQAAAERVRRERVLTAEGEKKAYTLQSEGVKIQLINESEGQLIQIQNEARATKEKIRLLAEGEAEARLVKAKAEAEALRVVAEALQEMKGGEAAQLQVAKQYIEMYGQMGKSSNTMLFSDRPADVNALIAQAAVVLNATGASKGGGSTPGESGVESEVATEAQTSSSTWRPPSETEEPPVPTS